MIIRPKKKVVPKYIPYLCALLYIVVVACIIAMFAKFAIWITFILGGTLIVLFALSRVFSWYSYAELKKKGSKVVYEIVDVIDTLGHDRTVYDLNSVSEIVRKGNRITLRGSFVKHEPLRKAKTIKKLVILDITDEAHDFIKGECKL